MFAAWKSDEFPAISNKIYLNIFSGLGFMAKRVRPLFLNQLLSCTSVLTY